MHITVILTIFFIKLLRETKSRGIFVPAFPIRRETGHKQCN